MPAQAHPVPEHVLDTLKSIVGARGFVTSPDDIHPYLIEQRGAYRGMTPIVLKPASTTEVARIVRTCSDKGVAIVPQGGRTGLCGGAVPDPAGNEVVVSLERMNRIRDLDAQGFTLTCEAGCILQDLQAAAEADDRLFPLSLAAEGSCMIGGNLSTNAGGINVLRYGMARNLTLGLEVVLPDGTVWDGLSGLRKDNRGYDLKQLFIGAEGTLGIITAAVMALFPRPRDVDTALLAVPSPQAALELFALARESAGDMITAFELHTRPAIDMVLRHIPDTRDPLATGYAWYVLIELGTGMDGHARETGERMLEEAVRRGLVLDGVRAESLAQRTAIWKLREGVNEAQKREGRSLKHDVSVPVDRVADFIEEATRAVQAHDPGARVLAFGHVGDGNIHFNVFPSGSGDDESFRASAEIIEEMVFVLADQMQGSFSAEHGIGLLKRSALHRFSTPGTLDMMRMIKQGLDPQGIMNPGKIL